MIPLPNKLYSFKESVLADFVSILRILNNEQPPTSIAELHARLSPPMPTEDLIGALSLLLALGKIHLDTERGVISRAD